MFSNHTYHQETLLLIMILKMYYCQKWVWFNIVCTITQSNIILNVIFQLNFLCIAYFCLFLKFYFGLFLLIQFWFSLKIVSRNCIYLTITPLFSLLLKLFCQKWDLVVSGYTLYLFFFLSFYGLSKCKNMKRHFF